MRIIEYKGFMALWGFYPFLAFYESLAWCLLLLRWLQLLLEQAVCFLQSGIHMKAQIPGSTDGFDNLPRRCEHF